MGKTIAEGGGKVTVTEGDDGWPRPIYLAAACQLMGLGAEVHEHHGRPYRVVLPHSQRVVDQIRETAQRMQDTAEDPRVGPTSDGADGSTDESDAEMSFAVGAMEKEQLVVVSFGRAVAWLGMSPEDARTMSDLLAKQAAACDEWRASNGEAMAAGHSQSGGDGE